MLPSNHRGRFLFFSFRSFVAHLSTTFWNMSRASEFFNFPIERDNKTNKLLLILLIFGLFHFVSEPSAFSSYSFSLPCSSSRSSTWTFPIVPQPCWAYLLTVAFFLHMCSLIPAHPVLVLFDRGALFVHSRCFIISSASADVPHFMFWSRLTRILDFSGRSFCLNLWHSRGRVFCFSFSVFHSHILYPFPFR